MGTCGPPSFLVPLTLVPLPRETIPIRLFLGGFDLAPTFRDINKKFSTRDYLNLVLIDEENRRYFMQQLLPFTFSTLTSLRPFSAAPSSARDPR
ncbi:hypothetical protein FB451DRAFT_1562303 [Mycena latifolia]|nr:hypothetical protein FB451DRAFT_1562303 [Mycena latifolia]